MAFQKVDWKNLPWNNFTSVAQVADYYNVSRAIVYKHISEAKPRPPYGGREYHYNIRELGTLLDEIRQLVWEIRNHIVRQ
jgi:predicted transcriptional regulator